MEQRNVIVIGAGNGGISRAAALAKQGLKPLVLEKHNLPGGLASSFVRGRFEFDVSIHCMFYVFQGYQAVMEGELGIDPCVKQIPNGLAYSYLDKDGNPVYSKYPHGEEAFVKQFKEEYPQDAEKMDELIKICRQVKTAVDLMNGSVEFDENFGSKFKSALNMAKVAAKCPDFLKIINLTTGEFLDKYNMPVSIRRLVESLWWYMADDPRDIPVLHLMGSFYFPIEVPVYYPKNTCHEYLLGFDKKIRELGGEIRYNTEVTEILFDGNNKVKGVKTADGETILAPYVVCDVDSRTVLKNLIHVENAAKDKALKTVSGISPNGSYATVYLGLNNSCEELGITNHHIYYIDNDDPVATYEASKTLHGPWTYGALCPNVTFPDFSPEGTCVLTLTMGMDKAAFEGLSQRQYMQAKQEIAAQLIDGASHHMGVNLRDYIEEIEIMTPVSLSRYGASNGGALGYTVNMAESKAAKKDLAQIENEFPGLHFGGQFKSGVGYSNVV